MRDKNNNDEGAWKFYLNPYFDVEEVDDKNLTILFYSSMVKNTIDVVESHRQLLNSNFQMIQSKYDNQINLIIAISAWVITFIGFIISLVALVGTIYNWWGLPI